MGPCACLSVPRGKPSPPGALSVRSVATKLFSCGPFLNGGRMDLYHWAHLGERPRMDGKASPTEGGSVFLNFWKARQRSARRSDTTMGR